MQQRQIVSRAVGRVMIQAGIELQIGPGGFTAPAWAAIVASAYEDPLEAIEPLRVLLSRKNGPNLVAAAFGLRELVPGAATRVADVLGPHARITVVSDSGDRPSRLIVV